MTVTAQVAVLYPARKQVLHNLIRTIKEPVVPIVFNPHAHHCTNT